MDKMTTYAKFIYEKSDEDLIHELEEALNKNAKSIINFFDSSLPKKIVEIRIIPTKEEYDKIVQKRKGTTKTPAWEIGNSYGSVIEYVSLHDYKNTSHAFEPERYEQAIDDYKKTIVHEYVHYIVDLYHKIHHTDFPLRYLNEGIAQYLSGQRIYLKQFVNYSLEDILNSNDCYAGWFLLTKYILEKYGKNYFLELLENNQKAFSETPRLHAEAKDYYDNVNISYNSDVAKKI